LDGFRSVPLSGNHPADGLLLSPGSFWVLEMQYLSARLLKLEDLEILGATEARATKVATTNNSFPSR
jgi:hypothetical protein